jgi:transglutaminase-like putative cysteine protease
MKRTISVLFTLALLLFVTVDAQTVQATGTSAERVTFTMKYTVTSTPGLQSTTLTFLMPQNLPHRQKIVNITYSQQPTEEFDANGMHYVRFTLQNPAPTTVITATVVAETDRWDLATAKTSANPTLESDAALQPFEAAEKYLEKDSPEIQKAAKTIAGATDIAVLQNVMAFVTRTLRPGAFSSLDRGAVWALENKTGDCTEFADLFVALCRAKNIPARYCEGYLVGPIPAGQPAAHNWAEAYTKEYGWVRFDPLHVRDRMATFDTLKPIYLHLSNIRNDASLDNDHYYRWTWQGNGNVKVTCNFTVTQRQAIAAK